MVLFQGLVADLNFEKQRLIHGISTLNDYSLNDTLDSQNNSFIRVACSSHV